MTELTAKVDVALPRDTPQLTLQHAEGIALLNRRGGGKEGYFLISTLEI